MKKSFGLVMVAVSLLTLIGFVGCDEGDGGGSDSDSDTDTDSDSDSDSDTDTDTDVGYLDLCMKWEMCSEVTFDEMFGSIENCIDDCEGPDPQLFSSVEVEACVLDCCHASDCNSWHDCIFDCYHS